MKIIVASCVLFLLVSISLASCVSGQDNRLKWQKIENSGYSYTTIVIDKHPCIVISNPAANVLGVSCNFDRFIDGE